MKRMCKILSNVRFGSIGLQVNSAKILLGIFLIDLCGYCPSFLFFFFASVISLFCIFFCVMICMEDALSFPSTELTWKKTENLFANKNFRNAHLLELAIGFCTDLFSST